MFILLIEDDANLGRWLSKTLKQSGHQVDWCNDGKIANAALRHDEPDCIILDLGLPDMDGTTFLEQIRTKGYTLPVLILTARDSLTERVRTLNKGADDFLAKPFAIEELEARLTALLRRARGMEHPRLSCGGLMFDPDRKQFLLDGALLSLPPREYKLLHALIEHSGQPLSKKHILDRVFIEEDDINPEAVEVLIHRLRKRLETTGVGIRTYRGLGYALEQELPQS